MNLKDKIKSYSFWVSLASAIILILKILGNRFGFVIDETMVSDLFTALCSILVLLGIIVPPQNNKTNSAESSLNCLPTTESISSLSDKIELDNKNCINQEESIYQDNLNNETLEENENDKQNEDFSPNQNPPDYCENIDKKSQNQDLSNSQIKEETTDVSVDLKSLFFDIKEKFSGNLDSYIFELQEEIRKTREGM